MNGNINFRYSSQNMIVAKPGGSVELYHNNNKKLETDSGGVNVTGDLITSGNVSFADSSGGANNRAVFGTGGDLNIYHNGTSSLIEANDLRLRNAAGDENFIICTDDGTVELYYDNSLKFHTRSDGIRVIGDATWSDNGKARFGPDGDLQLWHDGTNSKIYNVTGDLYIQNADSNSNQIYIRGKGGEDSIIVNGDGAVELFNDNVKKFETNSYGAKVTGYQTQSAFPIASLSHTGAVDVSNDDLDSGNCYDTVWVNKGSHFNASNGRFTCPVAGVYRLFFGASINNENTNVRLKKNGNTIAEAYSDDLDALYNVSQEIIVDCDANDYLNIQISGLKTMSGAQHKQFTFQLIA
tara:strand:- start:63 stop:1118 length:1056 start_codon:yes stop_codon:yes gene_type:complete